MSKPIRLTRNRLYALESTLMHTLSYHYPYDDAKEQQALTDAGLLDQQGTITLAGAIEVIQHIILTDTDLPAPMRLDKLQRAITETRIACAKELRKEASNGPAR